MHNVNYINYSNYIYIMRDYGHAYVPNSTRVRIVNPNGTTTWMIIVIVVIVIVINSWPIATDPAKLHIRVT